MGARLRFMSANLWSGAADADALAEIVQRLEVDVVSLQEVAPHQAEALNEVLPYGTLGHAGDGSEVRIGMRRPGRLQIVPMPWRAAHSAVLDPSEWPELQSPMHVVAMHLMAPHLLVPKLSLWQRPRQLRALEAHLAAEPCAQRVLLGDFNSTPSWPAYWRINAQFTDAAVAVADAAGTRPLRTWGPWSGAPRLLRIDHAFVSGLEVDMFRVLEVPGSDHSAIVLDVAPSGAKPATEPAE